MFSTEGPFNHYVTVVDVIQPQILTAGAAATLSSAIDMRLYSKLFVIFSSGELGDGEAEAPNSTVNASLGASATATGIYVALAGKSITELDGSGDDGKVITIEIDAEDLRPLAKRFVKFNLTATTENATCAAVILGVPALGGAANAIGTTISEAL